MSTYMPDTIRAHLGIVTMYQVGNLFSKIQVSKKKKSGIRAMLFVQLLWTPK